MADKRAEARRFIAQNRKARHDYHIDETLEAGIALFGTEVKSMRDGRCTLQDSFAQERDGEIYLFNTHIAPYAAGGRFNHEPMRPRKLLLHRRQIEKLRGILKLGGVTLIPLSLYFNGRGRAKVELALGRGKKEYDKRATEAARDWQRQKGRLLRARG
ncbi:MAG: SsrA-binding protein SmpB [Alphaproteobacteria bacterium]|nr:SsrA-binding protein SmpB [Alphaproteobacteria bacterium]